MRESWIIWTSMRIFFVRNFYVRVKNCRYSRFMNWAIVYEWMKQTTNIRLFYDFSNYKKKLRWKQLISSFSPTSNTQIFLSFLFHRLPFFIIIIIRLKFFSKKNFLISFEFSVFWSSFLCHKNAIFCSWMSSKKKSLS